MLQCAVAYLVGAVLSFNENMSNLTNTHFDMQIHLLDFHRKINSTQPYYTSCLFQRKIAKHPIVVIARQILRIN